MKENYIKLKAFCTSDYILACVCMATQTKAILVEPSQNMILEHVQIMGKEKQHQHF